VGKAGYTEKSGLGRIGKRTQPHEGGIRPRVSGKTGGGKKKRIKRGVRWKNGSKQHTTWTLASDT